VSWGDYGSSKESHHEDEGGQENYITQEGLPAACVVRALPDSDRKNSGAALLVRSSFLN